MRLVLVALLVLASCATDQEGDATYYACRKFRDIARRADILTPPEIREEMKEVNTIAYLATPAVKEAAHDLLVATTSGAGIAEAVGAMGDACEAEGF